MFKGQVNLDNRMPAVTGGAQPREKVRIIHRACAGDETTSVPYKHLRAHETEAEPVCRLLLEKKKKNKSKSNKNNTKAETSNTNN